MAPEGLARPLIGGRKSSTVSASPASSWTAFQSRGIVNTQNDQSQLHALAMMVDAYRALTSLADHARIDPNRIAVMGFSKGAGAAVYSSNERFWKLHSPTNVQFAAHIGLYTPCNVRYAQDDKISSKPIRMFHGIADDYVTIEPCRVYAERLKKAGADVALTEYPDAHHTKEGHARSSGPLPAVPAVMIPMLMFPVPMMVAVISPDHHWCRLIHHRRLGHDHRGSVHDGWWGRDDDWRRGDDHWQSDTHRDPDSCLGCQREGEYGNGQRCEDTTRPYDDVPAWHRGLLLYSF